MTSEHLAPLRPRWDPVTAKNPRRSYRVALGVAAALVATACGGDATVDDAATPQTSIATTTPSPTSSSAIVVPSSTPPAAPGTPIATGDSDYGVMLFDGRGQAIYLFDKEADGAPACYDACAADWPPVLTTGLPQASGAVRADLLGTVARADGSVQVTYGGHPLYFYAHEDPGQVLCHDVDDYGGTWLVVTPEGTPAP